MTGWQLQIFRVADAHAQELIAALLAGMDGLVVETAASDFDHFLIVESDAGRTATGVHRFLRSIDPAIRLIHTSAPRPATA